MIPKPLPTNFVLQFGDLDWREAAWGQQEGWLDWQGLCELAKTGAARTERGQLLEIELAHASHLDPLHIVELASCVSETEIQNDSPSRKWMYLALLWVSRCGRLSVAQKVGLVAEIYADFDYPTEIRNLVYYMPAAGPYDPTTHSLAENQQRLLDLLEAYVTSFGASIRTGAQKTLENLESRHNFLRAPPSHCNESGEQKARQERQKQAFQDGLTVAHWA